MKFYKILFLLNIVIVFACKKNETQVSDSINGSWNSIGSGWILKIEDSTSYSIYDITSQSCIKRRTGKFNEIEESVDLKDDTLSLKKGVITYSFTKAENLPGLCSEEIEMTKLKDPIYNFEVFAETVAEHYAFMDANNINWSNLYSIQKNKLKKSSSDAELYIVIQETLDKLNDNHAYLEAPDNVYEEVERLSEETDSGKNNELQQYGDFVVANMVSKYYLEKDMTKDSWLLQWGKLNDTIGYIQIKAMWLYADLKIPEDLIEKKGYVNAYVETFHKLYEGDYIEKEVTGVSRIMEKAMNDLSLLDAIILDVRFNGGGQDAVSFEILSHFIPDTIQVAKQKMKYGNKESQVLPLFIRGKPNAYTKPVYVLTSNETGSAAEAFSLATLKMQNVKRIGARTSGAMSTALEKKLPNGWDFSISNEIYMDNDGRNYENIGIPVDFKLNYPEDRQVFFRSVVNDLERDKKDILNAIQKLN